MGAATHRGIAVSRERDLLAARPGVYKYLSRRPVEIANALILT